MSEHSVSHGTFVVERVFPVPAGRVFAAFADQEQKRKWFGGPGEDSPVEHFDFRIGGGESSQGKAPDGNHFTFEATYYDIVPDNRIIYAYEMTMNGRRISVSVAAIELFPAPNGTRLKVTEHGAFLDGLDAVGPREEGTNFLIDQLGAYLTAS
ncbi:MAG TPA: SRPBCC family protein [Alphaproteobacteria bacterium]|nr:SRPBCC family protein [Alphaproteobacteria bacterium]